MCSFVIPVLSSQAEPGSRKRFTPKTHMACTQDLCAVCCTRCVSQISCVSWNLFGCQKNMLFHWTSTTCSPARPLRHVPARPFRHSRPRSLVHAEGMAQHQLSLLPRSRESQICVERAEKTVCFFPAWGVQRFLIWPNFWTGLEVLKINQWPHLPMP